jgi:hypothetical protein
MYIRRLLILVSIAIVCAPRVQSQTREFLSAPRVKDQLQIRLEGKTIRYSLERSDNFRDIIPDQIFVASSSIKLTYPRINPLRIQVTAAVSEADDPGHAAVAKLVDALIGFPALLKPSGNGQTGRGLFPPDCSETDQALHAIELLDKNFYGGQTQDPPVGGTPDLGPASLPYQLAKWINGIDDDFSADHSGPAVIEAVTRRIHVFQTAIDLNIKTAKDVIAGVDKNAGLSPANECQKEAKYIYEAIRLTNPHRRLQELIQLSDDLKALETNLTNNYAASEKWLNRTYYIVQDLTPKSDKAQKIVVKVIANKLEVSSTDGNLVTSKQDLGSATFTLREFSRFAPEVGAGLVVAFVNQPKYGTSINASGQTVVALAKKDTVSVDPTVMVDFVCRCNAAPYFQPMFQVGVAASKDVPAVLFGGGLRLFSLGKGDVAVGGGLALAWVKDLTHLKPGDVVTGTKDIEQDLSFDHTPRARPYFTIQYKF